MVSVGIKVGVSVGTGVAVGTRVDVGVGGRVLVGITVHVLVGNSVLVGTNVNVPNGIDVLPGCPGLLSCVLAPFSTFCCVASAEIELDIKIETSSMAMPGFAKVILI